MTTNVSESAVRTKGSMKEKTRRLLSGFGTKYGKRLLLSFALPWIGIMLFVFLYFPARQKADIMQNTHEHVTSLSTMLAFSVGQGLTESNFDFVKTAFDWSRQDTNVVFVAVEDESDSTIYQYNPGLITVKLPTRSIVNTIVADAEGITDIAPIEVRGQHLGYIVLRYSLASTNQAIAHHQLFSFGVTFLILFGGFWGVILLSRQALQLSDEMEVRKKGEHALMLSERKYRALVDNAFEGIYQSTPDGRFLTVNPAFVTMLGYDSIDEILALDIAGDVCADQQARNDWRQALKTNGEVRGCRTLLKRKDGTLITVLESAMAIPGLDGEPGHFEGTISDITEQIKAERELLERTRELERSNKELRAAKYRAEDQTKLLRIQSHQLIEAREAALHAARVKSEFLANMSHEIRTPLNGIIGMTSLMLDTQMTGEQREFTETIRVSGDSLLTIVNDILDYSKIEAGKLRLEKIEFEISKVIEEAIDLVTPQVMGKPLELLAIVDEGVPAFVQGDPGRLRQIIVNLLGNAVKFTRSGEIVVRAMLHEQTTEFSTIRFSVADTGIGISRETQDKLFQAFTQADSSTTRKYGGTGLGLAICKQLCSLMGGLIGVDSVPNHGSTFWFTAIFHNGAESIAPAADERLLEGKNVLIVDDNSTNRLILQRLFMAKGMRTTSVADGPAALMLVRDNSELAKSFDFAVIDMQMPGMDGVTLAGELRSDRKLQTAKFVLLSSIGAGVYQDLPPSLFDIVLSKPIKQTQLIESLSGLLRQKPGSEKHMPLNPVSTTGMPDFPKLKILVAEDNVINQKLLVKMLSRLGQRADVASNGLEAVEALKHIPYDMVMMDCQMPEMDGFEATRAIRNLETGNKHCVIIAITANAMQGDRERCIAASMDDYLSKPINMDALAEKLRFWSQPKLEHA